MSPLLLVAAACLGAALIAWARLPIGAPRYRVVTGLLTTAYILGARALLPDLSSREILHYTVGIGVLGYGHFVGGTLFARHRIARKAPAGVSNVLWWALLATSLGSVFVAWNQLLGALPLLAQVLVLSILFAVSIWHTAENDSALAAAYRAGLRLGGLDARPSKHSWPLALALVTFVAGVVDAEAGQLPSIDASGADFFAGSILYHLIGWLVFFDDRAALLPTPREGWQLRAKVAACHVPTTILTLWLVQSDDPAVAVLRAAILSPVFYLFWSMFHVAQTAWTRGAEA